jgi:hypothetical protein
MRDEGLLVLSVSILVLNMDLKEYMTCKTYKASMRIENPFKFPFKNQPNPKYGNPKKANMID